MSKELKTQWHSAFVSAMKLELIENGYQIKEEPEMVDFAEQGFG